MMRAMLPPRLLGLVVALLAATLLGLAPSPAHAAASELTLTLPRTSGFVPAVRIDGRDVDPGADERRDYGLSCRLYAGPSGLSGAPPDSWVLEMLRRRGTVKTNDAEA